jgi:hypothetical protein
VAIQFETLPDNICAFAEEVYDLCPDTVDQGVGLMNEQAESEEFAAARALCPELSTEMQRKIDERKQRFEAMQFPPELLASIKSSGFTTTTDMGIRLLALDLKKSKQLFLWWD